jgi:hypothetical protein
MAVTRAMLDYPIPEPSCSNQQPGSGCSKKISSFYTISV